MTDRTDALERELLTRCLAAEWLVTPDRRVSPATAAELCNLSTSTLRNLRNLGTGPDFCHIGMAAGPGRRRWRVTYTLASLARYLERRLSA